MTGCDTRSAAIDDFNRETWGVWQPPAPASAVEWIPANVVIPEETETPGKFDLDLFPHVRGVLEEIDNPETRRILMKWAARNGKTNTALAVLMFFAVTAPRPMLFCEATEESANDKIQQTLYPMLEACDATRPMLLPTHRRNVKSVDLRGCRIRRSFSGARSTIRGFPACYAVASEVSAYAKTKSGDASTIHMINQRGKLYPFDSKYLFESTPGKKGECNITALMLGESVDRRYRFVPCPHCGRFQQLVFGTPDPESPGIHWKKNRFGRSEPARAEETAWYRCENGCTIHNSQRPRMMRGGVWISEGQAVNEHGDIVGERAVNSSTVGFDELSSLHSLVISGWGQIAREFIEATNSPDRQEALRDFENSTLGRVWDPTPQTVDPDELAARLCHDVPRGICPSWAVFLTAGIDVQDDGQRFVWVVCAWGVGGVGAVIDHGESVGFENLQDDVIDREFPHADGGRPLPIWQSLMDSGDATETVYGLCRQVKNMLPCKGLNNPITTEYKVVKLDPSRRRNKGSRGMVTLCEINTDWTQKWIQRLIDDTRRSDEPSFHLDADSAFDPEFLDELLNEQRVTEIDKKGYPVVSWIRLNSNSPNDKRDALRYARVAASVKTKAGKNWNRLPKRKTGVEQQTPKRSSDSKPKRFSLLSGGTMPSVNN